jgi:hypothetical protein
MPVNYNLITNELAYQGLADIPVLIDDTSNNSPDYFRVSKLPKEFTSGKNTFHFKGNSSLFTEGSYVYIEVLDSNGDPIYYETSLDLESSEQTAIVTVFIKPTTPPGAGTIIICATASKDVNGVGLSTDRINVRWTTKIYIDASKRNDSEIVFDKLPEVTIIASTGSYNSLGYVGGNRFTTEVLTNLKYYKLNNTAVLATGSLSSIPFNTTAIRGTVNISSSAFVNPSPLVSGVVKNSVYTSTFSAVNAGFVELNTPLSLDILNSVSKFEPTYVDVVSASVTYELSSSLPSIPTENSYNVATVYFSDLVPQAGTVSKIRSYYRSAGVGEYIFSNETNIEPFAPEFGYTPRIFSASLAIPTVHRFDKFDFKFEFVNPSGYVAKQIAESLNNTFIGGNTYIGGDDNLITGSLFVAGQTGTGVQITGKRNGAMIRSLGYFGFNNAGNGTGSAGFLIYSGSIQSVLNSSEAYSGVGLELYANTSSYFKYKTSDGGQLLIRTNDFFIGTDDIFVSASGNNLEILNRQVVSTGPPKTYKTKFHLFPNGTVQASSFLATTLTGSDDSTAQTMMNTAIGLVDGKNIGRVLYSQPTPINYFTRAPYSGSTSFLQQITNISGQTVAVRTAINSGSVYSPWLNYTSFVPDISFYSLPFENTLTVLGNVYIDQQTFPSSPCPLALGIRCTLWKTINNDYSNFGLSGNVSSGSFTGSAAFISGTSGSISLSSGSLAMGTIPFNGGVFTSTPFKITVPIPTGSQDVINMINLDYSFFKISGSFNDFDFRAKFANVVVLSGRMLSSDSISGNALDPNQSPQTQTPTIP